VTSAEDNARIIRESTAWNNGTPPDIVWAAAGSAQPMLFVDSSLEIMRQQMETNYWSCAYIAHETLKTWFSPASAPPAASGKKSTPQTRHLIFTSSTIAFAGVAGYGPYGPSKAAIRCLSDILRSEVNFYNGARRQQASKASSKPTASSASSSSALTPVPPPPVDVQIHTVFPGTMSSPGLDLENQTKHDVTHILEDIDPLQTPDEAALVALKGLERGEYLVVTNWLGVAMRASAWMGSPRGSWWRELLLSWITAVAWLFIGPDMERQVWNYGKKWGLAGKPKEA
jgi:3-dehydrosphinganine reductase